MCITDMPVPPVDPSQRWQWMSEELDRSDYGEGQALQPGPDGEAIHVYTPDANPDDRPFDLGDD